MTIEELSQIPYILLQLKSLQLELAALEDFNPYKGNVITGMPRGGEARDLFVWYAEEKKRIEDMIEYNLKGLQNERKRINEYIDKISDGEVREIIRLRCVNHMNWEEIGEEVHMDRRTASRKFYDHFKPPTK